MKSKGLVNAKVYAVYKWSVLGCWVHVGTLGLCCVHVWSTFGPRWVTKMTISTFYLALGLLLRWPLKEG